MDTRVSWRKASFCASLIVSEIILVSKTAAVVGTLTLIGCRVEEPSW
jgi:hypothetical protein